jgi:hypothetical protein
MTNITRYKSDLERLLKLGASMQLDLTLRHLPEERSLSEDEKKLVKELNGTFERKYQKWYTESLVVIRQLIPDRAIEFEQLYKGDGKRREVNVSTYNIQDWLNGVRVSTDPRTSKKYYNDSAIATMRFGTQVAILEAVEARLESSLFDMTRFVRADLFDSEIDAARELGKNGFLRAAGAVTGVILEKHLAQVAGNHRLASRKQHPTISDLNDVLKNGDVFDVPAWRGVQRLGDLRNISVHNKDREPTTDEIAELINGVEKLTKTVF